jgi:hypothetical protein
MDLVTERSKRNIPVRLAQQELRHHEAHDQWGHFILGVAGVSSVLNTQQTNNTHRVHHVRILDVFRPVTNSLRLASDKQ